MNKKESFNEAYRNAKKAKQEKFQWNGVWYNSKDISDTKASRYASAEQVNPNTIEVTVSAPYKKIGKNTSGFYPINSNYKNLNGSPRTFFNYNNRMYYLTDNYNNIIGTSSDEEAAKNPNFRGWNSYTGSLQDLKRSATSQSMDRSNLNQVNQHIKNQQWKDKTNFIDEINNARTQTANAIFQTANIPNHIVAGGLKLLLDNNYKSKDYLKGLNINKSNTNLEQINGLGDIVEAKNPFLRFIGNGMINTYSLGSLNFKPGKTSLYTKKIDPLKFRTQETNQITGSFRKGNVSNEGMGTTGRLRGQEMTKIRTQTNGYTRPIVQTKPIVSNNIDSYVLGVKTTSTEFNMNPYMTMKGDLKYPEIVKNNYKGHVIEYTGGGNETTEGRAITGDFVPGTTSKNWRNRNAGSKVYSSNNNEIIDLSGAQLFNLKGFNKQEQEQSAANQKVGRMNVNFK